MHPYYEKNQPRLRKELARWLKPIEARLEDELGRPYADLFREVWTCYRTEMLERFPYIGGDGASGTKNLTGAFGFVALGVVCRRYGMSLERWGELITQAYGQFFAQIPGPLRRLAGKLFTCPTLVYRLLNRKDARNAANARENPGSFETRVQPPADGFQIIYHTTVCPLANFAAEYGYQEYMPYLCNLDYAMFAALGVPFYRSRTCADGDGYCDFKLKLGAPVVPAWPCHSADPADPLK